MLEGGTNDGQQYLVPEVFIGTGEMPLDIHQVSFDTVTVSHGKNTTHLKIVILVNMFHVYMIMVLGIVLSAS